MGRALVVGRGRLPQELPRSAVIPARLGVVSAGPALDARGAVLQSTLALINSPLVCWGPGHGHEQAGGRERLLREAVWSFGEKKSEQRGQGTWHLNELLLAAGEIRCPCASAAR